MAASLRFPPLIPTAHARAPRAADGAPITGDLRRLAWTWRPGGLRLRARSPWARRCRASDPVRAEEATGLEGSSEVEVIDNSSQLETAGGSSAAVMALLQSYKAAVSNNDEDTISDIESILQSIQDEKDTLTAKIALLSLDLSTERDKILRISADFDNFRKRTERERLSLMETVRGEVVEKLLPVLDNFERAKDQIKVENESEEKINTSYQSIYKQFRELLDSLGVEGVETVGHSFDPMLHEAIMREESMEFEDGVVVQEFRKGYKLKDRLLRPAMVKVSSGPGPAKESGSPVGVEDGSGTGIENSIESTVA